MKVIIEYVNGQWHIFYKVNSRMLNITGSTREVYEVVEDMKLISDSSNEIYVINTILDILEIYM